MAETMTFIRLHGIGKYSQLELSKTFYLLLESVYDIP